LKRIAQTLPHDEITVFGKSQPDLDYKANGEFTKQKKIMGAAVVKDVRPGVLQTFSTCTVKP